MAETKTVVLWLMLLALAVIGAIALYEGATGGLARQRPQPVKPECQPATTGVECPPGFERQSIRHREICCPVSTEKPVPPAGAIRR